MATTRNSSARKRRAAPETGPLAQAYRSAALIRAADEKAVELAHAGHAGLVVPATGLEALLAGTAAVLRDTDWVLPGVRQSPIALARGLQPVSWFSQLLGRIADPSRGRQEPYHPAVRSLNVFSVSTPTGSQLVHAAGVGRAMAKAGRQQVAVALCGEAAAATADFHTGVNFAAVWGVPVVFVVARGDSPARLVATETVAEKAEAYGLAARELDGGSLAEVIEAMGEAVEQARAGEPVLVDAACPDPPPAGPRAAGPRDPEAEERAWTERDPLRRAAESVEAAQSLDAEARDAIEAGAAAALRLPPPPAELLFDDVFARRTPALDAQLDEHRRSKRN